jgi:hypothetical protein
MCTHTFTRCPVLAHDKGPPSRAAPCSCCSLPVSSACTCCCDGQIMVRRKNWITRVIQFYRRTIMLMHARTESRTSRARMQEYEYARACMRALSFSASFPAGIYSRTRSGIYKTKHAIACVTHGSRLQVASSHGRRKVPIKLVLAPSCVCQRGETGRNLVVGTRGASGGAASGERVKELERVH